MTTPLMGSRAVMTQQMRTMFRMTSSSYEKLLKMTFESVGVLTWPVTSEVGRERNIVFMSITNLIEKMCTSRPMLPFRQALIALGRSVLPPCRETTLVTKLRVVFTKTLLNAT